MITPAKPGMNAFGSNIILDAFNNRVFNHEVFGISKRLAYASEGTINIVVDTTQFDKSTLVLLPFSISGFDAGPLAIDLYVGTVYTAATGTIWTGTDRNFCPPVVAPKVFALLNPTITNDGVKSEVEGLVLSDGVPAVAKIAGASKGDLLFKLLPGINYLIRIINTTASTGSGLIALNWFEV